MLEEDEATSTARRLDEEGKDQATFTDRKEEDEHTASRTLLFFALYTTQLRTASYHHPRCKIDGGAVLYHGRRIVLRHTV